MTLSVLLISLKLIFLIDLYVVGYVIAKLYFFFYLGEPALPKNYFSFLKFDFWHPDDSAKVLGFWVGNWVI